MSDGARPVRAIIYGIEPRLRHAVAGLIAARGGIDVIEADRPSLMEDAAMAGRSDLVIIDGSSGGIEDSIPIVRRLRTCSPQSRVVVFVRSATDGDLAVGAGADAWISGLESPAVLSQALTQRHRDLTE